MFFKKRATRATKHINPLCINGFMRSKPFFRSATFSATKRWMCWETTDLCVARNVLRFLASGFSEVHNIYPSAFSVCNQQNKSKPIV